jgi:hypothetical protein
MKENPQFPQFPHKDIILAFLEGEDIQYRINERCVWKKVSHLGIFEEGYMYRKAPHPLILVGGQWVSKPTALSTSESDVALHFPNTESALWFKSPLEREVFCTAVYLGSLNQEEMLG